MRFIDYINSAATSDDPRGAFITHFRKLVEWRNGHVADVVISDSKLRMYRRDYTFNDVHCNMLAGAWDKEHVEGMKRLYYEYLLFELAGRINRPGCDWRYIRKLQGEAAEVFASVNGWKHSQSHFSASALAQGRVSDRERHAYADMMDHPDFFRADKRAVCIVGHLYDKCVDTINAFAQQNGLTAYIAPDEMSFYFPGWATPVAYMRRGVAVVWPWYAALPIGRFAQPVLRARGVVA
jgi:hypothetical protein